MSVITRGVKNAFRNKLRTGAVVLILAIGMSLALSLLVAYQAVENRISELKATMGTTITIDPAGSRGFEGGGEPLTNNDVKKIQGLSHVSKVTSSLSLRLQKKSKDTQMTIGGPGGSFNVGNTSLTSPIEAGSLGARFHVSSGNMPEEEIALPITATGISGTNDAAGKPIKVTEGRMLKSGDTYSAVVGDELAKKNNLKIGSTFTAYDKTFTVVGIFDAGKKFDDATFFIPLATAQKIADQKNEVSSITVTADSIDNVEMLAKKITSTLGSSKADVSVGEPGIKDAITGLEGVKKVSMIGFIASLIAAGVIIFLIMTVIVRERRKEIGVLKAIGGGNGSIVAQFMVEAFVLITLGAAVGVAGALISSNSIANALVSTNANQPEGPRLSDSPAGGISRVPAKGPGMHLGKDPMSNTKEIVGSITTSMGVTTLLYGIVAAFVIALIGSALPAWFIAKVRPGEVMRGE